jgi:GNAT superfamily N-acetyltransferase
MKSELKLATKQDLDRLLPLVRAYHEFEHIDNKEDDRRAALLRLLGDRNLGGIWLIFGDDQLAGYIALCRGFSIEFNGFDGFIDEFYLRPGFRGQGIGRRALEAIKPMARGLEINALHLEVGRDNDRARRLYAAAGFEARDRYLLMTARLEAQ